MSSRVDLHDRKQVNRARVFQAVLLIELAMAVMVVPVLAVDLVETPCRRILVELTNKGNELRITQSLQTYCSIPLDYV